MKKNLFLIAILLVQALLANAQIIGKTTTGIQIDPAGAPFPLVTHTGPGSGSSAVQDTSKRITVWLESGLGQFTTSPQTWYNYSPTTTPSTGQHEPFMFATNLYDTTKGLAKPSRLISNVNTVMSSSPVAYPKVLANTNVKITPNTFDLVPGDTMVFAVTYNTFKDVPVTNQSRIVRQSNDYKLYFFYNNESTFVPVTSNNQSNIMKAGSTIGNCRSHNTEIASFNPVLPAAGINAYGFQNWICYSSLPANANVERSVFFTMLPINDSTKIGSTGSVYAVLTENDQVIGTDLIQAMPFRPAHDPNYLIQKPGCINLPKKAYPFHYTVHFQNTGAGRATEVKAVVHLPRGMNWNSLAITKATFAGTDYTNKITVLADRANNLLTVIFKCDSVHFTNYLLGTNDSKQPAIDPATMGEFLFTINSTDGTDDTLESYADIYFRSEYPSVNKDAQGYEVAVKTNTGVTNYKACCDDGKCSPVPTPCCKVLGLVWWWWLIILMLVNIIAWYLLGKRRKQNDQC